MLSTRIEIAAAISVLLILGGVPVWVLMAESDAAAVRGAANAHVITLTAVADGGIWTEEDVVGHSYWRHRLRPASYPRSRAST